MFFSILIITTAVLLIIYCTLLLYFRQGFDRFKQGNSADQPTVTVIVPAHNEADNLPSLLKKLAVQTYPRKLVEMILVDDRSTDDTREIIRSFVAEHPNVRMIRIPEEEISPAMIAKSINRSEEEVARLIQQVPVVETEKVIEISNELFEKIHSDS